MVRHSGEFWPHILEEINIKPLSKSVRVNILYIESWTVLNLKNTYF